MTSWPGSAGGTEAVGVAARRRYLVKQTGLAALALVVVGGLFLVLTDRWPPTASSERVPPAVVLGVAAIATVAALAARWVADLRSAEGRDLWSSADRARVSEVKARLVQRLALPPEDRAVAVTLVRAETSRAGLVANGVEALLVVAVPAVVLVAQFRATEAVVAVVAVAVVALAPRAWMWRRLVSGARTQGLLP